MYLEENIGNFNSISETWRFGILFEILASWFQNFIQWKKDCKITNFTYFPIFLDRSNVNQNMESGFIQQDWIALVLLCHSLLFGRVCVLSLLSSLTP